MGGSFAFPKSQTAKKVCHSNEDRSPSISLLSRGGRPNMARSLSEDEVSAAQKTFDRMDQDGNGFIDRTEAKTEIVRNRRALMGNPPDNCGLEKLADAEV